ncbi:MULTISPECIES: type II secretion system protein [unclassified Gemella]|uniref:type II secretion system protein n=1 Tax=unclassified Gemella TaxID=2624949 RepID=UPI001C04FD4D|nr:MULTISPECIES: type II secretion system protein [unclassified Gemella]MBU0278921.1 type II secretion system GspH family protein [Gemella sp. zg-1178]QWQ38477.1 type II secretion system GspH family protein [Gemella sp. zg-570]
MRNNKGFTLIEILAGIFIFSVILIFLVPNIVREYEILKKSEDKLIMKEILYEEILINKDVGRFTRNNYEITIGENSASIKNLDTGEIILYE